AGLFHLVVDELPAALGGLDELLAGGDVLSPDHVRRVLAAHPGLTLINGYGPTENTTFTACHRFRAAPEDGRSAPLGRPLGGTAVYVADAALRAQPSGVAGELVTGGAGLARGYLGNPRSTAERFVPDPFGDEPGARLYRTGDRVRWLPTGELEFLGRVDQQVKVRGFRIEPGEVEAVLAAHPAVRECAVLARGETAGDKRLVAWWTPEDGVDAEVGEVGEGELREHLAARLPEWMVPVRLVRLAALPLTPNGKLDRAALPEPEAAADGDLAPPREGLEATVAGLWRELLGVEAVGRESDFFALGGHSLLATRLVSRLRAALGVEVELRALFEAPTLAAFAARLEAARRVPGEAPPPLVPVDRAGPLPLSFAQQRLWFLDRLEPGSAAYNVPTAVGWRGELSPAVLAAALTRVVGRHEVLRTVYRAGDDGEPRQVVLAAAPVALPLVDLSALPRRAAEASARRLAAREAARPFDLAAGPVLRAALLRRAGDDHLVLLTLHHVATDGWSMGLLGDELRAAYRALAAGERPRLPELPVQYADYAAWQRGWLRGPLLEREIDWWRQTLDGLPPLLELPT
ncbi:MAG TPA: condensation domain-containing protein, partial [Thermoanaerobaculia bacterium]|nr:condensation domain-containing protein [Thermoanaerobaculia bacterium]